MPAHSGKIQILRLVAVVLLLAATLKLFVLDAVVVSGGSMEGTLLPGDFLLVDKTGYAPVNTARRFLAGPLGPDARLGGTGMPSRGEVVAFSLPGPAAVKGDGDAIIIKRCVAVAGDSLHLDGRTLRVNGVPVAVLDDPGEFFAGRSAARVPRAGDVLVLDSAGCAAWHGLITGEGHEAGTDGEGLPTIDGRRADEYTVAKSYIFVLGDNLPASRDSRNWGLLPVERVLGRALFIYWSLGGDGKVRWDRVGTFVD